MNNLKQRIKKAAKRTTQQWGAPGWKERQSEAIAKYGTDSEWQIYCFLDEHQFKQDNDRPTIESLKKLRKQHQEERHEQNQTATA